MSANRRDLPEVADEYVLGLLAPAEHARVDAELDRDPALRDAVATSRDRFLELDLLARPAADAAGLWDRIALALADRTTAGGADEAPSPLANGPSPRPAPVNDNAASRWRLAALSAMAASLLLVAGLGWSLIAGPEPRVVAVLQNEAGEPLVLVEDYGNASARVTPLTDFDVPAGRTMQVWTLPSQDIGPVSLGLLESSQTAVLDGPVLPAPREAQLYEITVEQEGGSPTGRPTGPILVKGFAKLPR